MVVVCESKSEEPLSGTLSCTFCGPRKGPGYGRVTPYRLIDRSKVMHAGITAAAAPGAHRGGGYVFDERGSSDDGASRSSGTMSCIGMYWIVVRYKRVMGVACSEYPSVQPGCDRRDVERTNLILKLDTRTPRRTALTEVFQLFEDGMT
jgi:hypothetical protein